MGQLGFFDADKRLQALSARHRVVDISELGIGLQSLRGRSSDGIKGRAQGRTDPVPPIRRRAYETVCQCDPAVNKQRKDSAADTGEIAIALGLPTNTARRALEDLTAHGLIQRHDRGEFSASRKRTDAA